MDARRADWWNADTFSNIWRNGHPTYWLCCYKGSGLWTLSGGSPFERWWTIYQGNPWRDACCIVVDALHEERTCSSWTDFMHARDKMDAKMKAALAKAKATVNPEQASDPDFGKTHPLTHGFMTEREGEKKGEFRETASLTMFCEDGVFKACLSDRETGATLWASHATLKGTLDALEKALGSDDPGWRVRKPQGQAKGKGGKR